MRVKRAFKKHEQNVQEWEKTIAMFQQLRYDRCLFDRSCGVAEKMITAKIMNSHRSPSALRTLIEMQKYYENPPLNKEESFLIKEKQDSLIKTF